MAIIADKSIAADTPNDLQGVTDIGNATTNDIDLLDSVLRIYDENGNVVGRLTQGEDPDFGLVLAAETVQNLRDKRLTLTGANILLGTEQLEVVFNGAEDGNFLRIKGKKDVQDNDVFVVSSVPLSVDENRQEFTSTADIPLTTSYQTLVNGLTNFDYRPNTSYGDSSFYVENDTNQAVTVEVGKTVGATTPTQTDTFTVPAKSGSAPGFRRISTHDTFTTDLAAGQDIHLRARILGGTAEVKGSVDETSLVLVQTSNLRNGIQRTLTRSAPAPIETGDSIVFDTPNQVYTLQQAALVYDANNPVEVELLNGSGGQIIIQATGPDSIYLPGGEQFNFALSDGESIRLRVFNNTTWGAVSQSSNLVNDRIIQLGTSSTNAQYATDPQTLLSVTVNYGYALAKITISFEVENTAQNRSTVVGLFIDGVLIDRESKIEPKDSRNVYYQSKVFDHVFSAGDHLIEVLYGKDYGGGGAMAEVSNVRIYVEELRL